MSKIVTFRKQAAQGKAAAEALAALETAWAYYTPEPGTAVPASAEIEIEHLFDYYAA